MLLLLLISEFCEKSILAKELWYQLLLYITKVAIAIVILLFIITVPIQASDDDEDDDNGFD